MNLPVENEYSWYLRQQRLIIEQLNHYTIDLITIYMHTCYYKDFTTSIRTGSFLPDSPVKRFKFNENNAHIVRKARV